MSQSVDAPTDRITYREGQRLTARDLQDDRDGRARLRRLHVLHLHETWGIATGFDVQAVGPHVVAVGAGYALDAAARDLVLSASTVIPVPAVTGPQVFVLVATFLPDCGFPTSAGGAAVCLESPVHPRRERPAFAWQTIDEFEPGAAVPICHVVVENKVIKGAVGTRIRRYARRLVRPYIATGMTDAENGRWEPWWSQNILNGFAQRVDTADAGFTGTPQYFAELVPVRPSPGHTVAEVEHMLARTYGHVREAARDSFVFQALVIEAFRRDLMDTWAIRWVGVQPMAGCPPVLNLKNLFTRAGRFFPIRVLP
jgi:hypothetical protein